MAKEKVFGAIDQETRCRHYHKVTDRVAIKCYCCREYFPCFLCHQEEKGFSFTPWPAEKRAAEAVLCGSCKKELTIEEYLFAKDHCPFCGSLFNPNCALHYHLYFEPEKGRDE